MIKPLGPKPGFEPPLSKSRFQNERGGFSFPPETAALISELSPEGSIAFRPPSRSLLFRIQEGMLKLHNQFVQSTFFEEGHRPMPEDIPNFRRLSERLYSGGQPTDRGFQWLLSQGVQTIVTFRSEDHAHLQSKRWPCFKHYRIPIKDRDVPTFQQVETFLDITERLESGVVYAHCRGGTGRAKTMMGCWQVAHGVTAERAVEEAFRTGVKFSKAFFFNANVTVSFSVNAAQQKFIRNFETYYVASRISGNPIHSIPGFSRHESKCAVIGGTKPQRS